VTEVAEVTVPVVTVKVAEVWPWATVTEAGTLAAEVLELDRDTETPPLPAADVRVMVPVAVPPLVIVLVLTETLLSAGGGGFTVTPKVLLTLEYEAVKVTDVAELTVPAVTVKVAEVWPWATVTEAGTLAAELLELESATETPPLPAADVSVTVPVAVPALAIVEEFTERLLRAGGGGLTVTPKVLLTLEYEAVRVTAVAELTVPAVTVKVAEVWPWATVTEPGTLAAELLELESDTETPPLPAADVSVTVPVAVPALAMVLEFTERLLSAGGGGLTVTPKILLTLEYEAVKVTDVAELTVPAVTVKVAEVCPCGTVTEAGTLAAELLELESATETPPLPAADVSVTVPVAVPALAMVLEFTERLLSAGGGGLTVIPKVLLTLEYEAVKVTDVAELTVPAVTVKVAEVCP